MLNPSIPPEIMKTMIDLRLGEKLFNNAPCPACASSNATTVPTLDPLGYHAMVCPVGLGATRRHNALRDTFFAFLKQPPLCLHVLREWKFPSQRHLQENEQSRLDLLIDDIRFSNTPLGIDVTVVSPSSRNFALAASRTAGAAATKAETLKRTKYTALCASNNVEFIPFGFDVHGGIGESARHFCRRLAKYVSGVRGTNPITEYHTIVLRLERTVLHLTALAVNRRRLMLSVGANVVPA